MSHKFLLIEPSGSLRAVLGHLAEQRGWLAEAYADLPPALARLDAEPLPDLVVTAALLPSGTYTDVVARVRACPGCEALPVALLSSDGDIAFPALECGVTEVFRKDDLECFGDYLDVFATAGGRGIPAGRRALVLDDDRAVGGYMAEILGEAGLAVDYFNTGAQALPAALHQRYDLLFIDLVLDQGRSGNGVIRSIRQSSGPNAKAPIVAVSAFLDSARRSEALRAGATSYLEKPVAPSDLVAHAGMLLSALTPETLPGDPLDDNRVFSGLSKRERLICGMVIAGYSDKDIAERLKISYWTVRTHITRIFKKCQVANRMELAGLARGARGSEPFFGIPDQKSLADHVVDNLHHGMVITDAGQTILHVNPAFTRITGYSREEAVGQTPRLLKSGKHDNAFYRAMFAQIGKTGFWAGEVWNRHKNGKLFLEWLVIRELATDAPFGARYVAVIQDVTERYLENERIRHSALHDPLTGLANRILLQDRAGQEIARARRHGTQLAVVFIDIDRFKPINDTLGHQTGDELLRQLAGRLRGRIRANDTIARYGGDEFVALLPDIDGRAAALSTATKLLRAFDAPFAIDGQELSVGASIGVSLFPAHGDSYDALVASADRAMYCAKKNGKGQIRFEDERADGQPRTRQRLENSLQRALTMGEFALCFQPKIEIGSRRIVGCEALVRWHSREEGAISPVEFIPLAEQTGLILPLGRWVLHESCRMLRRVHDAGFSDFSMAINVSPLQVVHQEFVAELRSVLEDYRAAPGHVQLELTEAVLQRDPAGTAKILRQLTDLGVSLALDDFGTGHSSLGSLRQFPFDTVKIDRQFVSGVHRDRYNESITRATVHLARGLDMTVVAEGIENRQEADFLDSIGCDLAQGFFYSGAVGADALLQMLAAPPALPD